MADSNSSSSPIPRATSPILPTHPPPLTLQTETPSSSQQPLSTSSSPTTVINQFPSPPTSPEPPIRQPFSPPTSPLQRPQDLPSSPTSPTSPIFPNETPLSPHLHPPTPAPTPNPRSSRNRDPRLPPLAHHNHNPSSSFSSFLQEAISATNPSLRHLASHSSLGSQTSNGTGARSLSRVRSNNSRSTAAGRFRARPLSTTFEEQRGIVKPGGIAISRNTRLFAPELGSSEEKDQEFNDNDLQLWDTPGGERKVGRTLGSLDGSGDTTLLSAMGGSSSLVGSRGESSSRLGSLNRGKYKEIVIPPFPEDKRWEAGLIAEGEGLGNLVSVEGGDSVRDGGAEIGERGEGEEIMYPGPLALTILITGIALSVFLISLDRTIITTAIPFISREFDSYSDIGWYGSAYLLTASAFQPLYGRIFTLFNMKWSYLTSLFMFELGSLICGVAPNSVTLIIGRAIAGLGSAGILTGSFVVVAHAVRIEKRPVMTAVVGLMFGVGATVGPLLGGVFTDLVTWRWCFYFNLPVGGATALAMIFFFHPPKKHLMMDKSFLYRILELDLIGNVFLLGASIQLFLALQYTEEQVSWGSSLVIGLLVGCFCTFVVFCTWMWWKADGALMPPRILGKRTVAASCAAGFFIYAAILIQTYYLPIYFQAIKGASAVESGVDMIPYVVANALFSLLAGVFVGKNGLFIIPAVVGMVLGTVGCGLISTFGINTSTGTWIGYEILASAGIGMAIQQGFTAVQIVLPLDEVAIGTAAVVAFQSLGGAVFVSVGNTILQNSLLSASRNNQLPGVDVQQVIDAGASGIRGLVPADLLEEVLNIYSSALRKVFTASIPMAGLAVMACCFLEFRRVRDAQGAKGNESGDEEKGGKKDGKEREELERRILEGSRRSTMSGKSEKRGRGGSGSLEEV